MRNYEFMQNGRNGDPFWANCKTFKEIDIDFIYYCYGVDDIIYVNYRNGVSNKYLIEVHECHIGYMKRYLLTRLHVRPEQISEK